MADPALPPSAKVGIMTHDPLCALSKAECRASQDARHSIVTNTAWCDACQDDCQCDLIAKVRTDERSRWNTPYFSVEYHRGYRQAQQDERQRWVETITSRIEDLRFCGKDDDCETKADGAELALDDGLYVSHAQTFPTPPAPPAQTKNGDPRVSYAQGYLDALEATSWTCPDCGNTYDPDITECPNRYLDEAKVAVRTAERRAGA